MTLDKTPVPADGSNPAPGRRPSGRKTRALWWTAIGIAAIVGLGATLTLAPEGDVAVSGPAGVGEQVSDIAMTDFEGTRFELAEYRGTPLVVNFWASWCPTCTAEMPDFEKVHQAVAPEVAFLGINTSDGVDSAQQLAKDTGVTYRLARDQQGEIFQAFGALGMPTTVFIDADGKVVDLVVGQLSADTLMGYIQRSFPGADVG